MKSIFITGSGGFIGSHIAEYFCKKDYLIYGMGRLSDKSKTMKYFKKYINEDLYGDKSSRFLEKIKPDYIFHCAGNSYIHNSFKDPLKDFSNNTFLTFKLLTDIKNYSQKSKIYFFSSAAVYGNPSNLPIKESDKTVPLSPYGFHKLMAENICREFSEIYSLNIIILRIFSVYGTRLRRQIFYDLMNKFNNDNNIKLRGTGNESRDFIHVIDLCRAIELIMKERDKRLEIYNIGTGNQISIRDLANMISNLLNSSKNIKFDLKNNIGMPLNWEADISKLKKTGFYKSIEIKNGIKEYIDWFNLECLP